MGGFLSIKARSALVAALVVVVSGGPGPSLAEGATTRFVNTTPDGTQANGDSYEVDVSGDGRLVVFTSSATNLAPDAGGSGIYLKNLRTGAVERIDVSSRGAAGESFSTSPALSSGGRFVAFSSGNRLVRGDKDNETDIYVRDRRKDKTELVGLRPTGGHWKWEVINPHISPDGRFVTYQAFRSRHKYEHDSFDAYLVDRWTDRAELISVSSQGELGDSSSFAGSISANGNLVTFLSYADNFSDEDSEHCVDVYLRNRKQATTQLISVNSQEEPGSGCSYYPQISADGRYVSFTSYSRQLEEVPSGRGDCFIRDRLKGKTHQINVRADGTRPPGHCHAHSISLDGRFAGFWTSGGERDIPGGDQVYWVKWRENLIKRASVSPTGAAANRPAISAVVSGNGNWIAFTSEATNLVRPDRNDARDVFRRGPMR